MSIDYYPKRRLDWLSTRERHVLMHMMDGLTCEQIATLDYVTPATVRSQIQSILMKLGVRTQLAAVAHAHKAMWSSEEERHAAIHQALGVSA